MDWEITQMDIKGTYLNVNLKEEVFMCQPEGFKDGSNQVCHLVKTIYGLKQARQEWNKELDSCLKHQGFEWPKADLCTYIWENDHHIEIIMVWVNNLLLFTNKPDIMEKLKKEVQTLFNITDLGNPQKIVGIEISIQGRQKISQALYIENLLAKYNMMDCKPVSTPMDLSADLDDIPELPKHSDLCKLYGSLVRSLMFLAIATQPDIIYAVIKLMTSGPKPGQAHWVATKQIL